MPDSYQGADLFHDALYKYLECLRDHLALVLIDRHELVVSLEWKAIIVRHTASKGETLITLSALVVTIEPIVSVPVALCRAFGGRALGKWLNKRTTREKDTAKTEAMRRPPKTLNRFNKGGPRKKRKA